jgi:DNA repair protein RadC
MNELGIDDRPREKLLRHGASALGDNELLALVVGSGCRDRNALAVANELLQLHGGLHGLLRSTSEDLAQTAGVGRARGARIIAALELGRRTLARGPSARFRMRSSQDAAQHLLPIFGSRPIEQFGVLLLDGRHRVVKTTLVTKGTANSTVVEPREVFRDAIAAAASAVIVFHNHPSGDPTPSRDDVELTRRLVATGVLVGIPVIDHLILGDEQYCSLKDMGHL